MCKAGLSNEMDVDRAVSELIVTVSPHGVIFSYLLVPEKKIVLDSGVNKVITNIL